MAGIINQDEFVSRMARELKDEMLKAAEPVVQKAMKEIEVQMRKRLAEMVLGLVDQSYCVDRLGADIRIMVRMGGK